MDRRLPLIFVLAGLLVSLFAQNLNQLNKIQILLWAEREAYPGIKWDSGKLTLEDSDAEENPYTLPVSRLKETAPFFVQGMAYGWEFSYTPSDNARGVKEYFEFQPVQKLTEEELNRIEYKNPAFKDDRLYCRVEFERTDFQKQIYQSWGSVTNPKIRGLGYGKLEKGFEGIQDACGDALKNAVREHWRTRIKNKPREISGRVLLVNPPVAGVDSGRYRLMLDFFIETDRILEYKMF